MTRQELAQLLQAAAKKLYDVTTDPQVQYAEPGFGDFSCNMAFGMAKIVGKPPREIASELAAALSHPAIARAQAAGAGFVNVTLTEEAWQQRVGEIRAGYSYSQLGKGRKVQVEFISANPTGPLTLANARGGYLGDVLSNVLAAAGYEVTREHYLNDAGGQIGKLVDSIKAEAGLDISGERQYTGSYIKDLADQLKPTTDSSDEELAGQAVGVITDMIKQAVAKMGITYDVWFSEQTLIDDGTVRLVLAEFKKAGLTHEKDGALWLASSKFGDQRDRVLVKSNGEFIYLLNDIAYHYNIFALRGFDVSIKIWGADHAGQVPSLKLAVAQLLPKAQLEFILLQLVRIMKDGKEFKSSKRAGTYITMDELLMEVGSSDVARFFFLMRSPESHMDFDIDLAKEQSAKNPYYYVMYSYARASSITVKAGERGIKPAASTELSKAETDIVKKMTQLPDLVEELAQSYEVHKLTYFAQEAAALFQNWYEQDRIIDLPAEEAAEKLYFVQQYLIFMEELFSLIGIEPVAHMTGDQA